MPNPVMVVVGEAGVVICGVRAPEGTVTTLHAPVPLNGVLAAMVMVLVVGVPQTV